MKSAKLEQMIGGWFVGAFSPTTLNTDACEVAIKKYKAGDTEKAHYHKVATEVTVIISGSVFMYGKEWNDGDIIVLAPKEITDFEAITDAVTVVVKIPGVLNDKYMAEVKE